MARGAALAARGEAVVTLSRRDDGLDITDEALDPVSLIRAILKAPADLLWFGGIGTYVKAASETHAQVGDRANDALRRSSNKIGSVLIESMTVAGE